MKTIKISTNNVLQQTINCINHSMDLPTSLGKGFMIETLKQRMFRGEVVRFCYEKLNGEIRFAVGTLQSDSVKSNVLGTGIPKRYYGMFAYIDLQKMAWRGFKNERLIGIVE